MGLTYSHRARRRLYLRMALERKFLADYDLTEFRPLCHPLS